MQRRESAEECGAYSDQGSKDRERRDELSSPPAHSATRPRQPGEPSRFSCLVCQQTFSRAEHLTRHARSHMKERFLKCSYCRKEFYRIDALRRHEQVHKEPKRSSLGRGARACLACAAARRKCSGGLPCSGCSKRTVECQYPESGRLRANSMSQNHAGNGEIRSSPVREGSRLGRDQGLDNEQDSPMSWSDALADESPKVVEGQDQIEGEERSDEPQSGRDIAAAYSIPYTQHEVQTLPNMSPQARGQGLSNSHVAFLNPALQNESIRTLNSDLGAGPTPNSDVSTTWYQNSFSSINWLPENWTPDFQVDNGNRPGLFDNGTSIFSQNAQTSPPTYQDVRSANTAALPLLSQPQHRSEGSRMPPQIVEGQEISSPGSQSTHSGHFYVDGDGARLPRVRKVPYRYSDSFNHTSFQKNTESYPVFMFPDIEEHRNNTVTEIPQNVYEELVRVFNLTCVSSNHHPQFHQRTFPSAQMFGHLISLYTENFQSILPCIHPSTFDPSNSHWLLSLALAAVGSHYVENELSEILVIAMHEFLRRALQVTAEVGGDTRPNSLVITQIKLFTCVGMIYSGDGRLNTIAKTYHSDLVSFCRTEWINQPIEPNSVATNDSEQLNLSWKSWREAESNRRTGYCIWLLDCMWEFHFQMRPLLSLEDARISIPCQEVLWEAESSIDWQQLYACATPSPSLHSAIQLAYIEKTIQSSTGEFSRILLIHALFRRTWEVSTYFTSPLALYAPSAEKQDISSISSGLPIWLPGIKTYSKWRNSACDCLDILHWHANSVIGAASGMEHPTVLHLHLARVILLTPFRETLQLAKLFISSSATSPSDLDPQIEETKAHLKRWALEDQHKARLAMIHAGVLFWHVRRYSTDAFYEPSSVFLATLALWAYGTFAAHTSPLPPQNRSSNLPSLASLHTEISHNSRNTAPSEDADESLSPFPTSIQLDRPADDELVQLFVMRGAVMRANITGVGNLCSVKGPLRVLCEGRNLLMGLKAWGEGRGLAIMLGKLIESEKEIAKGLV